MLDSTTAEMIDICSQCESFVATESGLFASLITAVIAMIVRKFEKRKMKKKM